MGEEKLPEASEEVMMSLDSVRMTTLEFGLVVPLITVVFSKKTE